jgi:hypothetical protein
MNPRLSLYLSFSIEIVLLTVLCGLPKGLENNRVRFSFRRNYLYAEMYSISVNPSESSLFLRGSFKYIFPLTILSSTVTRRLDLMLF